MLTLLRVCGLMVLLSQLAAAEVVKIEIKRKDDAGSHERVIGKVYFAIDPKLPANRGITDLDLAPRNAQGKVEFSSDLYVLKPKDPSRGNGVVFFDIVNRGNKQLLRSFSRGGGFSHCLLDACESLDRPVQWSNDSSRTFRNALPNPLSCSSDGLQGESAR